MKDTKDFRSRFDDDFRARLLELFIWRRDVRRFRRDPLPPGALENLIDVACLAPSVGLSQPWRFVIVQDPVRRAAILTEFKNRNAEALGSYSGKLADRYASLKLAGLEEAPAHLAVFADRETRVGHGLGRVTMPEMAEYSVVTAVHSLWLAARAENIGVGWVSILDPKHVASILNIPHAWRFIGYFCIGYPSVEYDRPELERAFWERRRPSAEAILRR